MSLSVVVNAVTRNDQVRAKSVSISKALRQVPTLSFRTADTAGSYYPEVGHAVDVQEAGAYLFGGAVSEVTRYKRRNSVTLLETEVRAIGYDHAFDRRLAGQYEWTDQTFKAIVTDIVNNSLSGDITDVTGVATGPTIDRFVVDFSTVREAFEALRGITGLELLATGDNKLISRESGVTAAPFSLTGTGDNVKKITTRETQEDLCNAIYIRVADQIMDPATETFTGASPATRSYTLANRVHQAPTILIDSAVQTVGIQDVDVAEWYWLQGSNEIRQDDSGVILTGANTLSVTYVGLVSGMVTASDATSITAYGRHEKLLELEGARTLADAQVIADNYIATYKDPSNILQIETDDYLEPFVRTTEPGQTLTVSLSVGGYLASGDYLIRSVNLENLGWDGGPIRWMAKIEAVQGPIVRSYVDVFRDLASGSGATVSGTASATGGSGVYRQDEDSGVTIVPSVAATPGARLVVYVRQGSPALTISFNADFVVYNTNVSGELDEYSVFSFTGHTDGRWWQDSMTLTGLTA